MNKKIKEELTTAMHAELLGDEFDAFELAIMDIYGAIKRGIPKAEALKKHDMPEEIYDANVERVIWS